MTHILIHTCFYEFCADKQADSRGSQWISTKNTFHIYYSKIYGYPISISYKPVRTEIDKERSSKLTHVIRNSWRTMLKDSGYTICSLDLRHSIITELVLAALTDGLFAKAAGPVGLREKKQQTNRRRIIRCWKRNEIKRNKWKSMPRPQRNAE